MIGSEYLEAVVLGVIQGIAEFLPISSSGHLVICGALWRDYAGGHGSPEKNLSLNVALHVGTLFSILWVYRRDLRELLRNKRLMAWIVIASIPAGLVGLTFKERIETAFATPLIAGVCLLGTALLLVLANRSQREDRTLENLGSARALLIGAFQAIALLPGISRSGSTIAGGLFLGLDRNAAATFSFFIAVPVIAGAALLTGWDVVVAGKSTGTPGALLLGAATSFLVGIASLRGLLRIVSQRRLHWFAIYCVIVGGATIIWQLTQLLTPGI